MARLGPAVIGRVQEARRNLRRATRQAKRECWSRFLQEARGSDVWTATGYTSPRIDKAGQALVAEDGTSPESHHKLEKAILAAHLPKSPPGSYAPKEGGRAFEQVGAQLVGALLRKAANTSAPDGDRISVNIIKVFWQWDKQWITQMAWACIRLGHHPELWEAAKVWSSTNPES